MGFLLLVTANAYRVPELVYGVLVAVVSELLLVSFQCIIASSRAVCQPGDQRLRDLITVHLGEFFTNLNNRIG